MCDMGSTCSLALQELSYGAVGQVCHVLKLLYQFPLESQDVGQEPHQPKLCFLK